MEEIHFLTIQANDRRDALSLKDKKLYRKLIGILRDKSHSAREVDTKVQDKAKRPPVAERLRKSRASVNHKSSRL
jgi:hypothetical protein